MGKNFPLEEHMVLEDENNGQISTATRNDLAVVLGGEIDAFKKSAPSFLKRLDYLQQGLESEPMESLVEEQHKLQEELHLFSRALEKYASQEKYVHPYESLICRDFCHTFRGRLANFAAFEYLLLDLRGETLDEDKRKETLGILHSILTRLIEEVKELAEFSLDIKKKTPIRSLLSDFSAKWTNLEVNIHPDEFEGVSVNCNSAVFRSIVKELAENYRKYGTDGKISLSLAHGNLKIALSNKKKPKEAHDYSSSSGLNILHEYLEMIGGTFESDYESDECTTIVYLPVST